MIAVGDTTTAALIGAGSAATVAGLGALLTRRKTRAETTDIFTQAAEKLVRGFMEQIDVLERRVDHAEAQVLRCEHSRHEDRLLMEQLEVQVRDLQSALKGKQDTE